MTVKNTESMRRVYTIVSTFFTREYDEGETFSLRYVKTKLVREHNKKYPNNCVSDATALCDGIRTLVGRVFERTSKRGEYRIVRAFEERDRRWFYNHYWEYSCKGKKYKAHKKQSNTNTKKKEKRDVVKHLKSLGSNKTQYQYEAPSKGVLETFQNQYPHRDYKTEFIFDEFTSLCPRTGQPDFAIIKIIYIPDELCIETKSLKLYFLSFRQYGSFMETITNRILEDCVAICSPRWMKVIGEFNVRGGTHINVEAEYETD